MALNANAEFDRARRRYYVVYETPAKRIGATDAYDANPGRITRYAPATRLVSGSDQFIETNGFYNKVNSTDEWDDVYFIPPPWGEPEAVEASVYKLDFFAEDNADTRLHGFDRQ